MKSILIAGDPNSRGFVDAAYGDLADISFASSTGAARLMLEQSPPNVLVGTLAFDDSQFLQLLPSALKLGVKVIAIDCPYTTFTEPLLDMVRGYTTEMGVSAWWDMRATVREQGLDAAAKEIRGIVQGVLQGGPDARGSEWPTSEAQASASIQLSRLLER